jgi:Uma2 family endonuclease
MSGVHARQMLATPDPDPVGHLWTRERIGGLEMRSPRLARRHASVASQLITEINYHFGRRARGRGTDSWLLLIGPDLRLGRDVIAPDIVGWRPDRAPPINDEAAFDTAPDWICEVLSPRTRPWARQKKLPLYRNHHIGHLWLVDPILEELEVFVPGERGWALIGSYSGASIVRAEPFESLELDLSLIWPERPEPPPAPAKPRRRSKPRS